MAWVCVGFSGEERVCQSKPTRYGDRYWMMNPICNDSVGLPKGTIKKLIKRCINETASTIRENLINGYWRGDLSDYFKDGNFDVSLKHYKDTSYYNVMQWLDKKK